MPYDAVKMADWQISEAAEEKMKPFARLCEELRLERDEALPYGRLGKLDFMKIIRRLSGRP
ncbi:MAG TPA: formate--tetrahydrofolate ligase, partial [Thermodesulfobacteriota bacterium]|nr:formate--tetrahydrofolate ligase [Thermodesulfobacteriota bacterium]